MYKNCGFLSVKKIKPLEVIKKVHFGKYGRPFKPSLFFHREILWAIVSTSKELFSRRSEIFNDYLKKPLNFLK